MYRVTYGMNQDDVSSASEEVVAEGLRTLRDARQVIRQELEIRALHRSREWVAASKSVVEGWCESLDPNCTSGYFIEEY